MVAAFSRLINSGSCRTLWFHVITDRTTAFARKNKSMGKDGISGNLLLKKQGCLFGEKVAGGSLMHWTTHTSLHTRSCPLLKYCKHGEVVVWEADKVSRETTELVLCIRLFAVNCLLLNSVNTISIGKV